MPPSEACETDVNALIARVAGGRRASETTQCVRRHAAALPPLLTISPTVQSVRWLMSLTKMRFPENTASVHVPVSATFVFLDHFNRRRRVFHDDQLAVVFEAEQVIAGFRDRSGAGLVARRSP